MNLLVRPLPLPTLLLGLVIIVSGMAAYCLVYNALLGRTETLANAVAWPLVNILPFALAFELGKRLPSWSKRLALIASMAGLSLLLGILVSPQADIAFELVRRLPTMLFVAALFAAGGWLVAATPLKSNGWTGELPLASQQINYVRSAGNYVELHGLGRTILHRMTISAAEEKLAAPEFVRIHRSLIVRVAAVEKWLPGSVTMLDGSVHPVGARYRANIAAVTKAA
jgi:LytTr DNA-binding domain